MNTIDTIFHGGSNNPQTIIDFEDFLKQKQIPYKRGACPIGLLSSHLTQETIQYIKDTFPLPSQSLKHPMLVIDPETDEFVSTIFVNCWPNDNVHTRNVMNSLVPEVTFKTQFSNRWIRVYSSHKMQTEFDTNTKTLLPSVKIEPYTPTLETSYQILYLTPCLQSQ